MKKELIVLAFLMGCLACRKNEPPAPPVQAQQHENWEIMSNPTDPLFAHVKNDSLEWEMYGQRDAQGLPARLSTVIYRSLNDTVFFHFDSIGRPISVRIGNLITYRLDWWGEHTLLPTMTSDSEGYQFAISPYDMITDIPVPENLALPVHTQSNNVAVNVLRCSQQDSSGQLIVGVAVRTGMSAEELYFPAPFHKTRNEASIPLQVPGELLPSNEYNTRLIRAMSLPHRVFSKEGKRILVDVCDRITASAKTVPWSEDLRQSVYASNNLVTRVFDQYCSITADRTLGTRLDTAKWLKRAFDPGVLIRPFIIYPPSHEVFDAAAVPLGMDGKTFSLDIGCDAIHLTSAKWKGYYTTNLQPTIKVPVYFNITVLKDLSAQAEWSTLQDDFSKFTFNGLAHFWGAYIVWSDGNGFSFPKAWSITGGVMEGTVTGCIDCNQPTTYKFWLKRDLG